MSTLVTCIGLYTSFVKLCQYYTLCDSVLFIFIVTVHYRVLSSLVIVDLFNIHDDDFLNALKQKSLLFVPRKGRAQ